MDHQVINMYLLITCKQTIISSAWLFTQNMIEYCLKNFKAEKVKL